MICYKGTIITCNENNAIAGYLVEDGGKILYAGDTLPAQYQTCRRISLGRPGSFARIRGYASAFCQFCHLPCRS